MEYETCGSAASKTIFSKVHASGASGAAIGGGERKVDVQAVYRKIAEYNGELIFPQSFESFGSNRVAASVTTITTVSDPAAAVATAVAPAGEDILSEPTCEPAGDSSVAQSSVMSALGSPVRVMRAVCPSTPQSVSTRGADPAKSLMSPLRSAPQRIASAIAPSAGASASAGAAAATPNALLRGATTPGKSRLPTCATPAYSNVVVSQRTKEVIMSLLRPAPTDRVTAAQLLAGDWLNSE